MMSWISFKITHKREEVAGYRIKKDCLGINKLLVLVLVGLADHDALWSTFVWLKIYTMFGRKHHTDISL